MPDNAAEVELKFKIPLFCQRKQTIMILQPLEASKLGKLAYTNCWKVDASSRSLLMLALKKKKLLVYAISK